VGCGKRSGDVKRGRERWEVKRAKSIPLRGSGKARKSVLGGEGKDDGAGKQDEKETLECANDKMNIGAVAA